MQSTSDSGRLAAAPNSAPAGQPSPVPRGVLVVGEWIPEPPALPGPPGPRRGAAERPARSPSPGRLIAGAAVILLHAAIGVALWMVPFSVKHPAPAQPLVLLADLHQGSSRRPLDLAADLPQPDLVRETPIALPLPALPREPVEVAISISAATDVMIGEVSRGDVEQLRGDCRRDLAGVSRAAHAPEITLLVRVERDGRISDSRIEVGSSAPSLDEAIRHCLIARSLAPRTVNGATVTSWQRVHWPSI
jgi:hypothetical protein